ncbi:sterol desaturase family protein [Fontimonas sp. SYSU GA230001]|uniref:sterol desaturase family protein n=1 Tax=Fontimonas sp. SYSU GA230001 TaxID=3142450 RepID=UPI0032B4CDF7
MKTVHVEDRRMVSASETAQRNPMRPPDTLPRTRGDALKLFWSHPSSLLIAGFVLLFGIWRVALGGLGWIDAAIAFGVLAYFPVNEWLIHVFMLHYKPRKLFGRTIDFYLPVTHRRHHADPWNLKWVFIPRHVHALVLPTIGLLLWALWPWKQWALTAVTTYLLLGLHYEWVHYLSHIPWCPEISYYQRRVREHRYHHFRNENYWWGVSMGLGDRLFGTAPRVEDIARSGTTRNLGLR